MECILSECFTLWPVESDLLWTVICTLHSQLCWAGYIKTEILGTDQIWQSYRGNDTIQQRKIGQWCVAENLCLAGICEVWELILLSGYYMLLECFRVCMGWNKCVSFRKIFIHPYVGIGIAKYSSVDPKNWEEGKDVCAYPCWLQCHCNLVHTWYADASVWYLYSINLSWKYP